MEKERFSSEAKKAGGVDWSVISNLVEQGRYSQVVEILRNSTRISQESGDLALDKILEAAQRICMICSQFQAEMSWYHKEYENASQREKELKQQLLTLIDIAGQSISSTIHQQESPPRTNLLSTSAAFPQVEKRPGLLARIRNLFKNGSAIGSDELRGTPPENPILPQEQNPLTPESQADNPIETPTIIPADILSALHPVGEEEQAELFPSEKVEPTDEGLPSLIISCLGPFRVYQDEQPVENWPSGKGKAVFKYLVTHRDRPVYKDVLMDLFWPDTPAESARNNLNVAIYGLRQALRKTQPSYSHVLFTGDCYQLNPEIHVWLDYEVFLRHIAEAHKLEERQDWETAMSEYSKAEALYQGEFFEEDRYEDWLMPQRVYLQEEYLNLLDHLNRDSFEKKDYRTCITVCKKMLAIDSCCEGAHRHLMRCYLGRGQPYMALRQYHLCVEALNAELKVAPSDATKELYEYIRRRSQS
jgi:DNA-binding SARP family transcriptional activator